jgi:ribonuclease-3
MQRSDIEKIAGTKVGDLTLYKTAFTHKSALKDCPDGESYENLEFMGDSVLNFIVTKYLFDKYNSEEHEGFLTKARTRIVRGTTLARISEALEMWRWIQMDEKGLRNGWNRNPKIMEDVLEAFIGAMYLDLGLIHTRVFVLGLLDRYPVDINWDDNYKDQLMRWCQQRALEVPTYVVDTFLDGTFSVRVTVLGTTGSGTAKNKRQAEQNSAFDLLKKIECAV